jgi:hypothetical protein
MIKSRTQPCTHPLRLLLQGGNLGQCLCQLPPQGVAVTLGLDQVQAQLVQLLQRASVLAL